MMTPSDTLELACDLISRRSITPEDAGCQDLMIERLTKSGFKVQHLRFDDVDNFWAEKGDEGPILVFAGHTDVVPTGDESKWATPPFSPTIQGDMLYGRGAADMKGSLAAMVTACERFVDSHPNHGGRIGFLITSDEEGIAKNGTVKVIQWLQEQNKHLDWCIVGEPSSTTKMGDTIKNGRRGSLGCQLRIKGIQGHVAYPHLADNPIHMIVPALTELTSTHWDKGNEFFPATSFQVSNFNGGTGATNVIPGEVDIVFNFRFSTEVTPEELQERTRNILDKHKVNYHLDWHLSGLPFLTDRGALVNAAVTAVKKVTGIDTALSTAGGTSDGRFIAPTGAQVVELGPVNATIHQIDECVSIADIEQLSVVYEAVLQQLLTDKK